tara:strand:- start:693 stop:1286 length:594 start_codon:yes stop_codon:yes gene_type:complete
MIHFYKPNAKVTGTACSFWFNNEENTFFSSMIKQDSWNSQKRTGSFIKNKSNPKATVIVKFSPTEIGGIIDSIESNREFSTYHSSQNQISKIKFGSYIKDDKQLGFSYTVNKESKEDSTEKSGFVIGFKYPEARLLKQYLINALNKSFKFFSNKSENTNYDNPTTHRDHAGPPGVKGETGRKDPVGAKEEEKDSFDW